jgi:heavy metal sensor kinase
MKKLPIRLRLSLWYFLVFAAAALLLSLMSWWMLRHAIDVTIQQDLQERMDDIRTELHQLGPNATPSMMGNYFHSAYQYRDDGKWLEIETTDGVQPRLLYRSPRMETLPAVPSMPRPYPTHEMLLNLVQGPRTVRMLATQLQVDGRVFRVETGISMNKPEALLQSFGLDLLLLTPGVLLVAAFAGHFMSRKALAPVAIIALQARQITDRNLDSRLPVSDTSDEISHLSLTLNHMLARIDVAFTSIRDFTANASHELRTPLARLRTQVEVTLFRPRKADEYRVALEGVLNDAIEMSSMVENLLTLARAEAQSEVLRLVPVDLGQLLRDISEEWTSVAERLSIRFEAAGSSMSVSDPSLFVLGDRLALLRLLRILVDNACKFTPAGGFIHVTTTADEDGILLIVEDSGVGIAPEHQSRIFDRFYRVGGDTSRQGAGLGLSLAKWIAEQHKTAIALESRTGCGAKFSIRLVRGGEGSFNEQESATSSADAANAVAVPIAAWFPH